MSQVMSQREISLVQMTATRASGAGWFQNAGIPAGALERAPGVLV